MNFFKSLLPSTTPPHIVEKSIKDIALEMILQRILLAASILFIVLSILTLTNLLQNAQGENFIVLTIAIVFIILLSVRQLPFTVRAVPVLLLIYILGTGSFLLNGVTGTGITFFLVLTLVSGVLLGRKAQIFAVIITIITYLSLGYLISASILPDYFPVFELSSTSVGSWRLVFSIFLVTMATSSLTVSSLFNELEQAISSQETLAIDLQKEQDSLSLRVEERTASLQKRSAQLRAIANISRNINSILDQEVMFQQVVNLLKNRMDLYYAGIFIVEETNQFAILKAGTGNAGRQMVTNNHRLEVGGSSMIGWSISNRLPRIALDVGEEAVRFNNPFLPETRSELALPIISRDNAIGALTIQSTQPNAFDEEDILIFEGIADSLSVALENARLFQQNQEDLNEIRFLSRQYLEDSWSSYLQASDTLASEFENPLASETTGNTYSHSIPVFFRNEEIGQIVLETPDEILSAEDQKFIDAVSAQAVMALESARLLQETRRQALQEEQINKISTQFTNAMDIRDVVETALKEISQLPSVSEIAVHLVPPNISDNNNGNEVLK